MRPAVRTVLSIRRECLDHVVVFGERHLRHILLSYMEYYNGVDTSRFEQRCAGIAGSSSCRPYSPETISRRTPPSLCSDLIFDRDSQKASLL